MSNETTKALADIIVTSALDFMASKANTTAKAIADTIATDPRGNAAQYFGQLVRASVDCAAKLAA